MKIARTLFLVLFSILLATRAGAQPCVLPITPDEVLVEQKFGTAYRLPLGVQSVELKEGREKTELEGFYLTVAASYLGTIYPKDVAEAKALPLFEPQPRENRFRRNVQDPLEYFVFPELRAECQPAPELWQNRRSQVKIQWGQTQKLLHELSEAETFGDFNILSTAKMKQHDVISMRSFFLQPALPGLYRVDLKLYPVRGQKPLLESLEQSRQVHVYFSCPDYQPALALVGGEVVQLQEMKYNIHLPIVNNVFFEEGKSARFTANPTDSLFRAILFGRVAEQLACAARDSLDALLFPDPLYGSYYKVEETLALSATRAGMLRDKLEELVRKLHLEQKCGASSDGRGRNCRLKFAFAKHRDGALFDAYIKYHESEDEAVKFREENRVVPLETRNADDDALLFSPLKLKPKEYPRHVQVALAAGNRDEVMPQCLEAGWITVTRTSTGEASVPLKLDQNQLQALQRGPLTMNLDALEEFFAESGEYAARLTLRSGCTPTELTSPPVFFQIKGQIVLLDEIFALSPYDNATFKYRYDARRIPQIIDLLFDKADSMMTSASAGDTVVAQMFVSGHTDTLAEHKGPYYNLGLSFRRAQAARDSLSAHLLRAGTGRGYINKAQGREENFVSADMQQLMRSLPHAQETTQEFFRRLKAAPRRSPELAQQYEFLKRDRMRHFRLPPITEMPAPPALDSAAVAQRLAKAEPDVAQSLAQITLQRGAKFLRVIFVTAGFGDKIPFYRRMHMTPELQRLLCAGDYARPVEVGKIYEIFALDRHPAGRVMNRRIEVGLTFDKNARPQAPLVTK